MSMNALLHALDPIIKTLETIDINDPDAGQRLNERYPLTSTELLAVTALVTDGIKNGWLCPRSGGGLRYGRAAKASTATSGFGIDTVDMTGPGPGHTHPTGEFDLCIPLEGTPTFDGNPPGWTVYPAGSWHVPTVRGGRMGILYFLPEGAIRFEPNPAEQ
jgi:hypothetical protein